MRHVLLLPLAFLAACGGGPRAEPAAPSNVGTGDPTAEPVAAKRTPAACEALLDHLQAISFEAIDREGIGAACVDEWSDARFDCMSAAADADQMEACWDY
jgi:hypothetical protein